MFLDVKRAIPLTALMGFVLTIFLLPSLWKDLEWRRIWPLLFGALPDVPIGILILTALDRRWLLNSNGNDPGLLVHIWSVVQDDQ
jgi:uncharacterized membrane protein YfcA